MMTNTKKAKERITDTFALLDCVGADVAIVNADTGEEEQILLLKIGSNGRLTV